MSKIAKQIPAQLPSGSPKRKYQGAEERRQAFVEAASELFLEHGYAGVSLEMVVSTAGGSYRDLYGAFGSKDELFQTVLWHVCKRILAPLQMTLLKPDLMDQPLPEALTSLAGAILGTLLTPESLGFHRLMVSEAGRVPDVIRTFFRSGPDKANEYLAAFLLERARQDKLLLKDARTDAAVFLDGLINNLQLKALTGHRVSKTDVSKRVEEAVRVFLNGVVRR